MLALIFFGQYQPLILITYIKLQKINNGQKNFLLDTMQLQYYLLIWDVFDITLVFMTPLLNLSSTAYTDIIIFQEHHDETMLEQQGPSWACTKAEARSSTVMTHSGKKNIKTSTETSQTCSTIHFSTVHPFVC